MSNILSVMTFLPIVGVLLLLFIPKGSNGVLRSVTLITTLATFLVTLPILTGFQTNADLILYATKLGLNQIDNFWI